MSRPQTFDHLQKAKKPIEVVVPIHYDDDVVDAYDAASAELAKAELLAEEGVDLAPLQEAKKAAETALRENTTFMRFRSIGRKAYQELMDAHPPTAEQVKEAKEEDRPVEPYADSFAPALIAACCVEPVITEEQAREIFETWNNSEIVALFQAAIQCNNKRRVTDLGNG